MRRSSSTARTITSSTWRRIRMGTAGLEGVGSLSNPKSWSWARRYSRRYAEGSVAKSWLPYPGAESSGVRITHYRWAGKGRWRARRDRPLLPATRSIAGTCSASQWDSPLRCRRRFSTALYQACAGKRFSLDEVNALLGLSGRPACRASRAVAAKKLEAIEEGIRTLSRLRRGLRIWVAACDANTGDSCPALERLAR